MKMSSCSMSLVRMALPSGVAASRARFFIGVELKEVVAGLVRVELEVRYGLRQARAGTLDLYHFGAEPGEKLCTIDGPDCTLVKSTTLIPLERCGVHVKAYFYVSC